MPQKRYIVNLPEGAELTKSHKDPGAFSALARDADGHLVHGTLTLDDDTSQDQGQLPTTQPTISQQLLATAVSAVIEATTDALMDWWEDGGREQTSRGLRRSWDRFKARRAGAVAGVNAISSSASEVDSAIQESASSKAGSAPAVVAGTERQELTVREAELAMLRLVVGELYVQHQRELLAGARIIPDRETPKQLAEQLAQLEQLEVNGLRQGLKELVERSPELLPSDLVAEIDALVGALADSGVSAGESVLGELDTGHDLPGA